MVDLVNRGLIPSKGINLCSPQGPHRPSDSPQLLIQRPVSQRVSRLEREAAYSSYIRIDGAIPPYVKQCLIKDRDKFSFTYISRIAQSV
jgi:hypothetical protein